VAEASRKGIIRRSTAARCVEFLILGPWVRIPPGT
jgi:hypothetical protein